MAGLAIAGWVVSPVIEVMIDKAHSYIARQWQRPANMEEELHTLETNLTQILSVVTAAERRRRSTNDLGQQTLLRQMKDAVYEAEDLLDEFDHLLIRAQAETGRKVRSLAASSSFITRHGELRGKLKKISKKLDSANTSAERFLQVTGLENSTRVHDPENTPWRATSSFLLESQVIGRDKERDEIIELLLTDPGDHPDHRLVLPIVGDGGIGKTTLAQLVYNDERVVGHFDLRMWICVSDSFDETRLTREILASASDDVNGGFMSSNLNMLQDELRKKLLRRKKFLLVLDDVWNDEKLEDWANRDRWRRLFAPLRFGEKGSKILVTTRMEMVAKLMGATNLICLRGLGEGDHWLLLKKYALMGCENPDDHPDLVRVGKQIGERLKGSPLGAKVVGGMLSTDLSVEKWKNVLRSNVWDGLMPVLRLSYQNLPEHLQRCFGFCSIFPKDWKFEPDRLVYMWMAQGFVGGGNSTRMEDTGRVYFNDLLSRSFFQKLEQGDRTYYVMHDLMNDLARTVSREECFIIEGDLPRKIPPTVRHLSINTDNDLPHLVDICELEKLRTLVFFGSDHILDSDVFVKLKSIRLLDLTGCDMEDLPEALGHLIHLRYLALCSTLRSLPESLSNLCHLQVLNASTWCWFGQLPKKMNRLISLRHLNVCSEYVSKIAGIGKLTCLQGLAEFHIKKMKGHKIEELKGMKELRGSLDIRNLEHVKSMEEALDANLGQKEFIGSLRLEWGSSTGKTTRHDAEVLEGLQPHHDLEELGITRYRGSRSPSWLETNLLSSLRSICLNDCREWKSLPPLGQLPCLRLLKISRMDAVEQVGCEFYGSGIVKGFPSLEYLRFEKLPNCVEWSGLEGCELFPRLCTLEIRECPKLVRLPSFPPSLTNISIRYCGPIFSVDFFSSSSSRAVFTLNIDSSTITSESFLHRHRFMDIEELNFSCFGPASVMEFQELISLKRLRISHCPEILASLIIDKESALPTSLVHLDFDQCGVADEPLSRCLQNLTSLSTLKIQNCAQIQSLPSENIFCCLSALQGLDIKSCKELKSLTGLHGASSLKGLAVIDCPKLLATMSVGEDDCGRSILPSSLVRLEINSCGITDSSLSKCLQNLASLSTLKIEGCQQITSLPTAQVLHHLTALQQLSIRKCLALTSLAGLQATPSLRRLGMFGCPKLLESIIPGEVGNNILPSSLESLEISSCSVTDMPLSSCLQNLTSLSMLNIEGCHSITSLPPAHELCHLTALQMLHIEDCNNLTSVEGLLSLVSLTDLNIEVCPKLNSTALLADMKCLSSLKKLNIMDGSDIQSLPENGLPASLEYFSLLRCDSALKEQLEKKAGLEWNKIAHVSQIFF